MKKVEFSDNFKDRKIATKDNKFFEVNSIESEGANFVATGIYEGKNAILSAVADREILKADDAINASLQDDWVIDIDMNS